MDNESATPGIVSLLEVGNVKVAGCYESCDASGCDCFDSDDCHESCDRAPD
ncbi:MAG: hypothetical protein WBD86_01865 [Microgenomates group bacterium]